MSWYHGSQNNNLVLESKPLYLTSSYGDAEDWALGYGFNYDLRDTDNPTVYTIKVNTSNTKIINSEEEYEDLMDITVIEDSIPELKQQGYDSIEYSEIGFLLVFDAANQCQIIKKEELISKKELLRLTTIDKIAGAWGEHYSESDGYLDLLDGFLYNQLLDNIVFNKETNYNEKIEAMGLFFDIIQNKNLYYNSAKEDLKKCVSVLDNILKTEDFSSWKDPDKKRESTEQFLKDMKDFLKNANTRSTTLFANVAKEASSEDLEISRGEIGISLDDNDPTKDKEKSTKNRWSEKPNQNTAVIPAMYQKSDNYKKDKLDSAKYTNFLGMTDQQKPVEFYDFAAPGRPVSLDDYFNKHTDTLQDDQQQYDTRNFGKGKIKPTQYSNFLYKNELFHITTLDKIAAEGEAGPSITPSVNDKVVESVTQKPIDNVTQGKGGGKPTKGTKSSGGSLKPLKALYVTDLKNITIVADQFSDGVTRTELPESSLRRFRQQDANDKNKKEQDEDREKMKGKPNKPLHNIPKKDVYAWGNDDLLGGTVFYSNMSLPQMGDLSEM